MSSHGTRSLGEGHLCWAAIMAGFVAESGWALDGAAAVSFRLSASSDCAQMASTHQFAESQLDTASQLRQRC